MTTNLTTSVFDDELLSMTQMEKSLFQMMQDDDIISDADSQNDDIIEVLRNNESDLSCSSGEDSDPEALEVSIHRQPILHKSSA